MALAVAGLPAPLARAFGYSRSAPSLATLPSCCNQASTSELVFKPDDIIAYLTRFVTIKPGDLIFTGTPSDAYQPTHYY